MKPIAPLTQSHHLQSLKGAEQRLCDGALLRPTGARGNVSVGGSKVLVKRQRKYLSRQRKYQRRCLICPPRYLRSVIPKLRADDIKRMTARLTARGDLSDTTVRYVYVVLRIALGEALRSKRVVRNVALGGRAPKATHRERTPLALDQVATFLESVEGDRLGVLYMTAIGLGLRQGEILALR